MEEISRVWSKNVAKVPFDYEGPHMFLWMRMQVRDGFTLDTEELKRKKIHYKYKIGEYWEKRDNMSSFH